MAAVFALTTPRSRAPDPTIGSVKSNAINLSSPGSVRRCGTPHARIGLLFGLITSSHRLSASHIVELTESRPCRYVPLSSGCREYPAEIVVSIVNGGIPRREIMGLSPTRARLAVDIVRKRLLHLPLASVISQISPGSVYS